MHHCLEEKSVRLPAEREDNQRCGNGPAEACGLVGKGRKLKEEEIHFNSGIGVS